MNIDHEPITEQDLMSVEATIDQEISDVWTELKTEVTWTTGSAVRAVRYGTYREREYGVRWLEARVRELEENARIARGILGA